MNIEIANRLVELRKAHGYSQEELAAKLGLSRQAVSKWERAESSPDTDNLIMLSRLYGVSLDKLLATDDEIPRPEPQEEPAAKTREGVHISFENGINVNDGDGSRVHIGWDGIHVHESNGDGAEEVVDGEPVDSFINDFINDIEVDGDGVSFTKNGERVHRDWNSFKDGKRRYVHQEQSASTGKWRTTVINEEGRKMVFDTNKKPHVSSSGEIKREFGLSGFPYTVLVTGVFLLLGFLKGWWHPAWLLFLTIPVYYPIASAIRKRSFSWLDIAVPVVVVGVYVALGKIYNLWHPLWMILLILPAYYGFSSISSHSSGRFNTIWIILVCAAYLATGFALAPRSWTVNWLLFLTIPMAASISSSIRNKVGRRWIKRFPWELLILAGYLFVGLWFGIWHPTWLAFLLIPVWRWIVDRIAGPANKSSVNGEFIEDDDDDDDDDDD